MMTRKKGFAVEITSVPDRASLVAELWVGDLQVAELAQMDDGLVLQFYCAPDGRPWTFNYDEFLSAVTRLKDQFDDGS